MKAADTFRYKIKSPDTARELFSAWKSELGKRQMREDTYLAFGESFTVELKADGTWRLVPLREA